MSIQLSVEKKIILIFSKVTSTYKFYLIRLIECRISTFQHETHNYLNHLCNVIQGKITLLNHYKLSHLSAEEQHSHIAMHQYHLIQTKITLYDKKNYMIEM